MSQNYRTIIVQSKLIFLVFAPLECQINRKSIFSIFFPNYLERQHSIVPLRGLDNLLFALMNVKNSNKLQKNSKILTFFEVMKEQEIVRTSGHNSCENVDGHK